MPKKPPSPDFPPRWGEFAEVRDYIGMASDFTTLAAVNRFGARYRLANSMLPGLVRGYDSAQTGAAYTSILKLLLAWSVLEALMISIGLNPNREVRIISERHDHAPTLASLRQCGEMWPFFEYVASELHWDSQKKNARAFIDGEKCCALNLARGIRHIFIHGTLNPNINDSKPKAVADACFYLRTFIFEVMDAEYLQQLEKLIKCRDASVYDCGPAALD